MIKNVFVPTVAVWIVHVGVNWKKKLLTIFRTILNWRQNIYKFITYILSILRMWIQKKCFFFHQSEIQKKKEKLCMTCVVVAWNEFIATIEISKLHWIKHVLNTKASCESDRFDAMDKYDIKSRKKSGRFSVSFTTKMRATFSMPLDAYYIS